MALALLSPAAFTAGGASAPAAVEREHLSGLMARITLPSGAIRTVKIDGLGCTASICSRTTIKGKIEHDSLQSTWLDSIATIKDTKEAGALLVKKDGTQRRISFVTDFRVLYLTNGSGATEKMDLARVKSVEFLAPLPTGGAK
jgi:hypothetical protein